MTQFLGTHQSKLDSKGRVSVPAAFRAKLRSLRDHDDGALEVAMVLRPSHQHPCIEVWPERAFNELTQELEHLSNISEAHDDLATTLFADAYPVESDREGRIVLADDLLRHAGITGPIAFMGIGSRFQIWEPDAALRRRDEARQRLRDQQQAGPRERVPA
jgi:MraZ protein